MKIGTLTLHLPFNYGNALQMFSLHKFLLEQGYDAEVLSRWFLENQDEMWHWHNYIRLSLLNRIKFALYCFTWTGRFCQYLREVRFRKWHDSLIRWSKECGAGSSFPAAKISHDIVIVGSDQIWNPKYDSSEYYLLPDFSDNVFKIAYAASLGTDCLSDEKAARYAILLKRFSFVSVRECSAVGLLRHKCSCNTVHVADPVLLHSREDWFEILNLKPCKAKKENYVVYTVTPDGVYRWHDLLALAKKLQGKEINVFAFNATAVVVSLKFPFWVMAKTIVKRILLWFNGVRFHFASTPSEFVQAIANSNGLFTDSFHGLVFATIFGKPCNVKIGNHEQRVQMGARLHDFVNNYLDPTMITKEFDPKALKKTGVTSKLRELISFSKTWLTNAINHCHDRSVVYSSGL